MCLFRDETAGSRCTCGSRAEKAILSSPGTRKRPVCRSPDAAPRDSRCMHGLYYVSDIKAANTVSTERWLRIHC